MPPSVCSSRCMSTQQNKSHPQPPLDSEDKQSANQMPGCVSSDQLEAMENIDPGKLWTEKSTAQGLWRAARSEHLQGQFGAKCDDP